MKLPSGRATSPLRQALTIFHKRTLIVRNSWLTPFLAVILAVGASTIPLIFIKGRQPSCVPRFRPTVSIPLYLPNSPILPFLPSAGSAVLNTPPGIITTLGLTTAFFAKRDLPNEETFVDTVTQNYRNLTLGGISLDLEQRTSLVAWEATSPGLTGPTMLNMANNIQLNRALNTSARAGARPTLIRPQYESFPPVAAGTLFALKWVAFFGLAMVSVYTSTSCHKLTYESGGLSGIFCTVCLEGA